MKRFRSVRPMLASLAAILLLVGLLPGTAQGVAPQGAVAQHDRHDGDDRDRHRHRGLVDEVQLPVGFQPEGIAIDGRRAYFGSLADGRIFVADLRTGEEITTIPGPGTPSVGLKIDRRDRLWVSGGPEGEARVVNARTGRTLATYEFAPAGTAFINDVVLTPRVAWFTDSFSPVLYGVPTGRHGRLADQDDVIRLELGGDYAHVEGEFNLNGIERTPDGRALLAIQSVTGTLYRISPRTGDATVVDLGPGVTLPAGDGILLDGRILYVVQNQLNQVAVVKLNRSGTRGTVVDTLTDPRFDVPTTVTSPARGSIW